MVAFLKGGIAGAVFTSVVSAAFIHGGADGGWLAVREYAFANFQMPWSWVLFLAGTGIGT